MNERINELIKQSHMTVQSPSGEGYTYFSQEKFAELILTEVTDILSTYRCKIIFVDGFEYNCAHPIVAIRKHFGVEE